MTRSLAVLGDSRQEVAGGTVKKKGRGLIVDKCGYPSVQTAPFYGTVVILAGL